MVALSAAARLPSLRVGGRPRDVGPHDQARRRRGIRALQRTRQRLLRLCDQERCGQLAEPQTAGI